jgi:histidyl-tRNA synthetase
LAKANTVHLENKDSTEVDIEHFRKALRYDLTVPFARYVVHIRTILNSLLKDIKSTCVACRASEGRFREFFNVMLM